MGSASACTERVNSEGVRRHRHLREFLHMKARRGVVGPGRPNRAYLAIAPYYPIVAVWNCSAFVCSEWLHIIRLGHLGTNVGGEVRLDCPGHPESGFSINYLGVATSYFQLARNLDYLYGA